MPLSDCAIVWDSTTIRVALMANDEHVALLKKGVDAWNAWRRKRPDIIPDLMEANLVEADLFGANLTRANIRYVALVEADLSGADLTGCRIYGVRPSPREHMQ